MDYKKKDSCFITTFHLFQLEKLEELEQVEEKLDMENLLGEQ